MKLLFLIVAMSSMSFAEEAKHLSPADTCIYERANLESTNAALLGEITKLRKQLSDAQGGENVREMLKRNGVDLTRFQGVNHDGTVKLAPEKKVETPKAAPEKKKK